MIQWHICLYNVQIFFSMLWIRYNIKVCGWNMVLELFISHNCYSNYRNSTGSLFLLNLLLMQKIKWEHYIEMYESIGIYIYIYYIVWFFSANNPGIMWTSFEMVYLFHGVSINRWLKITCAFTCIHERMLFLLQNFLFCYIIIVQQSIQWMMVKLKLTMWCSICPMQCKGHCRRMAASDLQNGSQD